MIDTIEQPIIDINNESQDALQQGYMKLTEKEENTDGTFSFGKSKARIKEQTTTENRTDSEPLFHDTEEERDLSPEEIFTLYQESLTSILESNINTLGRIRRKISGITSVGIENKFFIGGTWGGRLEHLEKFGLRTAGYTGVLLATKLIFGVNPLTNRGATLVASIAGANAGLGSIALKKIHGTDISDAGLIYLRKSEETSIDENNPESRKELQEKLDEASKHAPQAPVCPFIMLPVEQWPRSREGLIGLAKQAHSFLDGQVVAFISDPHRSSKVKIGEDDNKKPIYISRKELLKTYQAREAQIVKVAGELGDSQLTEQVVSILCGMSVEEINSGNETFLTQKERLAVAHKKVQANLSSFYYKTTAAQTFINIVTSAGIYYGTSAIIRAVSPYLEDFGHKLIKGASGLYKELTYIPNAEAAGAHTTIDNSPIIDLGNHTYGDVIDNMSNNGLSHREIVGRLLTEHSIPVINAADSANNLLLAQEPTLHGALQESRGSIINIAGVPSIHTEPHKVFAGLKKVATELNHNEYKMGKSFDEVRKEEEFSNALLRRLKSDKISDPKAMRKLIAAAMSFYNNHSHSTNMEALVSQAIRAANNSVSEASHAHTAEITSHIYSQNIDIQLTSGNLGEDLQSMGIDPDSHLGWETIKSLYSQHPELFPKHTSNGLNMVEFMHKHGSHLSSLLDIQASHPDVYQQAHNLLTNTDNHGHSHLLVDVKVEVPNNVNFVVSDGEGFSQATAKMGIYWNGEQGMRILRALWKAQQLHPHDSRYRVFGSPDMASFMDKYRNLKSLSEIKPNTSEYNWMLNTLYLVYKGNYHIALAHEKATRPVVAAAHKVGKSLVMIAGEKDTVVRPHELSRPHLTLLPGGKDNPLRPVRELKPLHLIPGGKDNLPRVHTASVLDTSPTTEDNISRDTTPAIHTTRPSINQNYVKPHVKAVAAGQIHIPQPINPEAGSHLAITPEAPSDTGYIDLSRTDPYQAGDAWFNVMGQLANQDSIPSPELLKDTDPRLFLPGAASYGETFQVLDPNNATPSATDPANIINIPGKTNGDPSYITHLRMGFNNDHTSIPEYGPYTLTYGYSPHPNSFDMVVDMHGGSAMLPITSGLDYAWADANYISSIDMLSKPGATFYVMVNYHGQTYAYEYTVQVYDHNHALQTAASNSSGTANIMDYANLAVDNANNTDYTSRNSIVVATCVGLGADATQSGPGKGINYGVGTLTRVLKVTNIAAFTKYMDFTHKKVA